MDDLPLDGFATANENSAMVLLVDDQAMIGEAVRRGLASESNIDFHFFYETADFCININLLETDKFGGHPQFG